MSNEILPYVIVVAVDYTDIGDLAFDHALRLAHHPLHSIPALGGSAGDRPSLYGLRADLHVVWVSDGYDPMGQLALAAQVDHSILRKAAQRLKDYATTRAEQSGLGIDLDRIVCHCRTGKAAHQIVQIAHDLRAELVVVGTHGRTGIKRLILGSVAEKVTRLAPCPVLIVRKSTHDTDLKEENVEAACVDCLARRKQTNGEELFCVAHDERQDRAHTSLRGSDLQKHIESKRMGPRE